MACGDLRMLSVQQIAAVGGDGYTVGSERYTQHSTAYGTLADGMIACI